MHDKRENKTQTCACTSCHALIQCLIPKAYLNLCKRNMTKHNIMYANTDWFLQCICMESWIH